MEQPSFAANNNNNFILCKKRQKLQIAGNLVVAGQEKYINNTTI